MCERLLGRHVLELGARATAKRATRTGDHQCVDLFRLAPLEALVKRGVLAVDGQDPASASFAGLTGELTGGDEALLVRERQVDAPLERPERGVNARESDHCVEHDVGLGAFEELCEVTPNLFQRRVDMVEGRRARRGRAELELRMPLDDLDRLATDRPRCPEQRDALHRASVRRRPS